MSVHFYNGILYQIEYQPQLSNDDYTQHRVKVTKEFNKYRRKR